MFALILICLVCFLLQGRPEEQIWGVLQASVIFIWIIQDGEWQKSLGAEFAVISMDEMNLKSNVLVDNCKYRAFDNQNIHLPCIFNFRLRWARTKSKSNWWILDPRIHELSSDFVIFKSLLPMTLCLGTLYTSHWLWKFRYPCMHAVWWRNICFLIEWHPECCTLLLCSIARDLICN